MNDDGTTISGRMTRSVVPYRSLALPITRDPWRTAGRRE